MPRFSSRRPRRRMSRPSRRRRGLSTRAIAVKALRSTDQERKFFDNTFEDVVINDTTTGASIFPVNAVFEGTANTQRIGKKMAMRSLYLQLFIEKAPADVSLNGYVRLMVILDRQPNGGTPAWTNILDLAGTGNPAVELLSANNLNNSKRFVTLYDTRMHFQKDFHEGRLLKKFLPLSQTVQYNAGGGTIANIATNSLLLCLTGHITTGGNVPIFGGTVRLRFVG